MLADDCVSSLVLAHLCCVPAFGEDVADGALLALPTGCIRSPVACLGSGAIVEHGVGEQLARGPGSWRQPLDHTNVIRCMLVEALVDVDPGDAPITDLVIRKLSWTFDTSVPFQWQPANPLVGVFGNIFTFFAVPFEKYIMSALRDAKDHAVADETDAFVRQEGKHSCAHRKHMNTLINSVPGLRKPSARLRTSSTIFSRPVPLSFTSPASRTSKQRSPRCSSFS